MSASTNGPQSLAHSLSSLLKGMGVDNKMKEFEALASWSSVVGETVGQVTKPEKVLNGVLFVKVKNSVWRNELIYMKAEILSNISKAVGDNVINDIKYI